MKIRFSKTLAAVLAATTVTAISGISAMAASVKTTTNYTYGSNDATVTVKSVITASDKENAQVTYLVAAADPSAEGAIKYIDQAPITDGTAEFEFTATQSSIYGANITAKFGSDAEIEMPTFSFVEGVDYFDNSGNNAVIIDDNGIVVDAENNKTTIYGTLTGNVTEYGVSVKSGDAEAQEFKAYATTEDTNGAKFAIVIYGWQYNSSTDTVAGFAR